MVKIAYFVSDADFLYQDEVKGSLISMPDEVIDLIYSKYFKGIVSYDGLQRVERFPLPRAALREAVLNAIVHKDYSYNTPIQIKIYDDRVIIHNARRLPDNWTIADLMSEHASMPFNPLIANAFFRSGLIETWGRGIEKTSSALRAAGLKEAVYTATGKIITITFTTENQAKSVVKSVVNLAVKAEDIKSAILKTIEVNPRITRQGIAAELSIKKNTVEHYLSVLKAVGRLERKGSDKSGEWVILK
ncbi:MAG: hypothetical protein LBF12_04525 [Christensenellaceae bacterium]|nr:hypothetical protein [Christensenellaceae bacterium]